jgi:threonine dehydratase
MKILIAELKAADYASENNLPYVSPYNDIDVICGQGTISYEINENMNIFSGSLNDNKLNFDEIYVSVGGGGLISGISGYFKDRNYNGDVSETKIIGVQPENSAIMYHSIKEGRILSVEKNEVFFTDTISDGTAGGQDLDSITFEMCKDNVDEWILLNEEEIKSNLLEFMEKEQQIIEGAAAMVIAACKNRINKKIENEEDLKDKNFLLIFCGKNISINKVKKLLI